MTKLMTASLGPEDRGRGYGVLRHTLDDAAWRRHRPMLDDFSMALAAWADLEAPPFAALFALDEEASAFALCRASYLGRAELGTVAVANVVIIPAMVMTASDHRAHKLLSVLPEADGAAFGTERLDLSTAPIRTPDPVRPMAPFGLEWRDHVLETAEDLETTLIAAFESISPPVQRVRVKGWSTSPGLVISGGFDPGRMFQLVMRRDGEAVGQALAGHRFVRVREGQVEGAPEPEPDAWRAWTVVQTLTDQIKGAPRPAWRPQDQTAPVEHVVALALLQAALPLEPQQRVDLLAAAVAHEATPPDLRAGMLSGASDALSRIMLSSEPLKSGGYYLEAILARLGPGLSDAAEAFVAAAPLSEALDGLGDRGRLDMVQANGLNALAAREIRWPDMETASIAALLEACTSRLAADPAARRLTGPLVGELAGRGPKVRHIALRGLATRLAATPAADDLGLASPAIAALARELEPDARRAYAHRALRPILRGEAAVGRVATISGLKAALSLV